MLAKVLGVLRKWKESKDLFVKNEIFSDDNLPPQES